MDETKKRKRPRGKHLVEKLKQAAAVGIVGALDQLSPLERLADATGFRVATARHGGAIQSLIAAETAVAEARKELKVSSTLLGKGIKSMRAGAVAVYGDDSEELQRVGVKRMSQRKRAVRKVKRTPA